MKIRSSKQHAVLRGLALAVAAAVVSIPPVDVSAMDRAAPSTVNDQASASLRAAAESGLRRVITDVSAGLSARARLPADFPIAVSSPAELRQVRLGYGFEVHAVDSRRIGSAGRSASLNGMIVGTGVWNFVVLSQGRPVALLEMDRSEGRWQVMGIGRSTLSASIDASAKTYRDFRYVKVPGARANFLEVRSSGQSGYVPLGSLRKSTVLRSPAGASSLLQGGQMLQLLKAGVQRQGPAVAMPAPATTER